MYSARYNIEVVTILKFDNYRSMSSLVTSIMCSPDQTFVIR